MNTVTVDGIEYEVEHTEKYANCPERVVVWTMNQGLIGDALVDDNVEQIFVTAGDVECEYSYFEYVGENKVHDLARFIISQNQ